MTHIFCTTQDKLLAAVTISSLMIAIYGFFGLTGFAVIGTVIALVAFVAILCWINQLTGGALGFLMMMLSLS